MIGLSFLSNGGGAMSFGRVSAFLIVMTGLSIISWSVYDAGGDPSKIDWEGMGDFILAVGFVALMMYGGSKGLDVAKIIAEGMYGVKAPRPPNQPGQ